MLSHCKQSSNTVDNNGMQIGATYRMLFGNLHHCFPRHLVQEFGLSDEYLFFGCH